MLNYEFKVDVNSYSSKSFPVAVYRRRRRLFARWEHIESCRTQQEACSLIADMLCEMKNLPRYF